MERLTKSEKELMDFFWEENREPLTSNEIAQYFEKKSWKASYAYLLISNMLKKGCLKVVGFKKTSKNFARTLLPAFTKEEYYLKVLEENGVKMSVIECAIKQTNNNEQLEKWKEMIEEKLKSKGEQ